MKEVISNLLGFLYTLSMGDYIFFTLTFILILLFIYVIFLLKNDEEASEIIELENIKNRLENEYKPGTINLTEYENEQEQNAIISYEELLNKKETFNVNYDENFKSDTTEIDIKKISLKETNLKEQNDSVLIVKLMSYDKEEAFLVALKKLQQNLIN